MRGQQTRVLLVTILAAGAVFGACLRGASEAEELPITVTDSGVRVTLASLKELDNLLILTFRVVNELSEAETTQAAIKQGALAIDSDLWFISFTYNDDVNVVDETVPTTEPTAEVEVMVEKPEDPSRSVSFAFTQLIVPLSPGEIPVAVGGRWEFRFVPEAA